MHCRIRLTLSRSVSLRLRLVLLRPGWRAAWACLSNFPAPCLPLHNCASCLNSLFDAVGMSHPRLSMHCVLLDISNALCQDKGQGRSLSVTQDTDNLPFLCTLEVDGAGVVPLPLTQQTVRHLAMYAQLSVALAVTAQQLVTVSLSCVWRVGATHFRLLNPDCEGQLQSLGQQAKLGLGVPQVSRHQYCAVHSTTGSIDLF